MTTSSNDKPQINPEHARIKARTPAEQKYREELKSALKYDRSFGEPGKKLAYGRLLNAKEDLEYNKQYCIDAIKNGESSKFMAMVKNFKPGTVHKEVLMELIHQYKIVGRVSSSNEFFANWFSNNKDKFRGLDQDVYCSLLELGGYVVNATIINENIFEGSVLSRDYIQRYLDVTILDNRSLKIEEKRKKMEDFMVGVKYTILSLSTFQKLQSNEFIVKYHNYINGWQKKDLYEYLLKSGDKKALFELVGKDYPNEVLESVLGKFQKRVILPKEDGKYKFIIANETTNGSSDNVGDSNTVSLISTVDEMLHMIANKFKNDLQNITNKSSNEPSGFEVFTGGLIEIDSKSKTLKISGKSHDFDRLQYKQGLVVWLLQDYINDGWKVLETN